jgi:acyl carrier protein
VGYPLSNGFGMTETGIISFENSLDPEQRIKGSIGGFFSRIEYRIGDGTVDWGELFLRGGALYSASMVDGKIVPRDESAWFATGDLIKRTPDGLFVCGRVKDVIINANGENIYPDEMEDFFSEITGVVKSCLIGAENGSCEDIAIVSQPAENFDRKAYLEQIRKINESLPIGERVTRAFLSNDSLPVSGSMKVMRHKIKDRLAEFEELPLSGRFEKAKKSELNAGIPAAASGMEERELDEIRAGVRDIIAESLRYTVEQRDAISYTDAFVEDLKMNSIDFFCCVADIEEQYGIVFHEADAWKITNIDQASKYIYAARHGLDTGV